MDSGLPPSGAKPVLNVKPQGDYFQGVLIIDHDTGYICFNISSNYKPELV